MERKPINATYVGASFRRCPLIAIDEKSLKSKGQRRRNIKKNLRAKKDKMGSLEFMP